MTTRMGADSPTPYAVVGDPIEHSLSPRIHSQFAAATGQQVTYTRERVPAGALHAWLGAFAGRGGRGINVTLPLKEEALVVASHVSERARAAGAANTLWLDRNGHWCADNTDGQGLVVDLSRNLGWPLRGANLLILGAGGATRGVIAPLLKAGVRGIWLCNRTRTRAERLLQTCGAPVDRLRVCEPGETPGEPIDGIVNATSAGLSGELPAMPAGLFAASSRRPWCYDMVYGAAALPWGRAVRGAGAVDVSDGLGMLVEQAAEAFWVFRGVKPDTRPVLAALRTSAT
jgi:shikimate dehydrogenase